MAGIDKAEAVSKAETVLMNVLSLQDTEPSSPTYGHWPLGLDPTPQSAQPNVLPAELMGILLFWSTHCYADRMSDSLRASMDASIRHLYRSRYYRVPLEKYNHHEAKYTATKLIFGAHFRDQELYQDGQDSLRRLLDRCCPSACPSTAPCRGFGIGFKRSLARWIAFGMNQSDIDPQIVGFLWNERAAFYLRGAWIGAHSRGLPVDLPTDRNVGFDYVQFGDFALSESLPRIEYTDGKQRNRPEINGKLVLFDDYR